MAIAIISSGTQLATVDTENSLVIDSSGKTYVVAIDLVNMTTGDITEIKLYTKVLSTSSSQLAYTALYRGIQSTPAKFSVPVPAKHYFEVGLLQSEGTARSYPWSLMSLD